MNEKSKLTPKLAAELAALRAQKRASRLHRIRRERRLMRVEWEAAAARDKGAR